MEAKQCDLCDAFYVDRLDSHITRDVYLPLRIKGQREGMHVLARVTVIPMVEHGKTQTPIDLCPEHREHALRAVADHLLSADRNPQPPKRHKTQPLLDARGQQISNGPY
jgi:hypothetical protein